MTTMEPSRTTSVAGNSTTSLTTTLSEERPESLQTKKATNKTTTNDIPYEIRRGAKTLLDLRSQESNENIYTPGLRYFLKRYLDEQEAMRDPRWERTKHWEVYWGAKGEIYSEIHGAEVKLANKSCKLVKNITLLEPPFMLRSDGIYGNRTMNSRPTDTVPNDIDFANESAIVERFIRQSHGQWGEGASLWWKGGQYFKQAEYDAEMEEGSDSVSGDGESDGTKGGNSGHVAGDKHSQATLPDLAGYNDFDLILNDFE